jgi:hypothetical protein
MRSRPVTPQEAADDTRFFWRVVVPFELVLLTVGVVLVAFR